MRTPVIVECPPAWERRLKHACDNLNALLAEARRTHPHAELYLSDCHLNLMWAAAHGEEDGSGVEAEAHQERILCCAYLNADGGGW